MENEAGTGWPSDSDKDYPPLPVSPVEVGYL